jgi:hypothetical protein
MLPTLVGVRPKKKDEMLPTLVGKSDQKDQGKVPDPGGGPCIYIHLCIHNLVKISEPEKAKM